MQVSQFGEAAMEDIWLVTLAPGGLRFLPQSSSASRHQGFKLRTEGSSSPPMLPPQAGTTTKHDDLGSTFLSDLEMDELSMHTTAWPGRIECRRCGVDLPRLIGIVKFTDAAFPTRNPAGVGLHPGH